MDTQDQKEHLNAIINLNNGNKAWTTLDYLKAFAKENKDYKTAYTNYIKNSNNISAGNIVHLFFGSNPGGFKKGECKIKDLKFSLYLLRKISNLVSKYGKRNIQAYGVREMIKIGYISAFNDYEAMDFLFKEYGKLAKIEHPAATSILRFKPLMEATLLEFNKLRKTVKNEI